MNYVVKFLSLQKAELEYEVELRGGMGDSVQELRKQIVKLSQALPSEDILESHLMPADDLKGVKESLSKSQGNLTSLKLKFDKNLFSRTETLLHHIYHRVHRINKEPDTADVLKITLFNFNAQYKELCGLKSYAPQPQARPSPSAATDNIDFSALSVTCERNLTSDISKLKYSGKTCVRSFIQRVEEFVQSRGISFDKILSLAFEIFVDDALHWYRCNKDRVQSWKELCELLKEDFSSSDYDYKLAAEIRSRTQGENENITIYLSIMHGMFSRLTKNFSEEDKLEILLHNIRPCYASTLAACPEIRSIDTLKSLCRNYENIKSRFAQFQEPPKVTSCTLAPEFAYKTISNISENFNKAKQSNYYTSQKYNNSNTYYKSNQNFTNYQRSQNFSNNENKSQLVTALSENAGNSKPFCPRCRTDNHTLKNCKQERFLICFKCGKKDVRFSECPDCNQSTEINSKN